VLTNSRVGAPRRDERVRELACALLLCAVSPSACAHPSRLSIYDEAHRPRGYHWTAHRVSGTTVEYYGVDPTNRWAVYVGPDGVYYTFAHAPPITTADLRSYWDPHDAPPALRATPRPTPR